MLRLPIPRLDLQLYYCSPQEGPQEFYPADHDGWQNGKISHRALLCLHPKNPQNMPKIPFDKQKLEKPHPGDLHIGLKDLGRPKPREPLLRQSHKTLLSPLNQPTGTSFADPAQLRPEDRRQVVLLGLFQVEKQQKIGLKDRTSDASEFVDDKKIADGGQEVLEESEIYLQKETQLILLTPPFQ